MDTFHTDGLIIRDDYGRQRIFRGINICIKKSKVKNFKHLFDNNSKHFFEHIKPCGVNIVRFGITWAALEPHENEYNTELIEECKKFVKKCSESDIYVLLDMHQDLFADFNNFGDGAPKWAIEKGLKAKKPFAVWAEGYFYMNSVQKMFSNFWNNSDGIQDKFMRAWKHFASQFNEFDNIIGLDYFNEPYIDKNGRNVFLSIVKNVIKTTFNNDISPEKYFERFSNDKIAFAVMALKIASIIKTPKRLKCLLKYMDDEDNFRTAINGLEEYTHSFNSDYYQSFIDKMDMLIGTDTFSFFEHNYYSNLGIPFNLSIKDNYIYSPHAYDIFIDSPLYNKYSSDSRIKVILDSIRENQIKMNVPVIFGEWGGGGPLGGKWIEHIDYVMSIFEKYHWSSIYWGLQFRDEKLVNIFNRPYPVAVCGDIKTIHTDSKKRIFTLEWEQNSDFENSDKKTLIYVPEKDIVSYSGKTGMNKVEIKY
ncbi:MAG: cellulase family glycosylhydrolase [Eubacterium sp.]|nr:cellulase family glycosylhydrolase [Eubacterium sp.]